jgi:DNA-binding NarL/FixJ family response regulator
MKMNDSNLLPCNGCDDRSSCRGSCPRLHKFLRDDPECHTRIRATEVVLPSDLVIKIADYNQRDGSRLDWQDVAGATLGYLDIQAIDFLTDGEKAILSAFYTEGMSYKSIASRYQISYSTVERQLIKIKKELRRVYITESLRASDKG